MQLENVAKLRVGDPDLANGLLAEGWCLIESVFVGNICFCLMGFPGERDEHGRFQLRDDGELLRREEPDNRRPPRNLRRSTSN